MKLPAIENYFYLRNTLKHLSKKGYGELSEVDVNLIFSIYCMNDRGLLCTKKALYEFMCSSCHTPHKTKFFATINSFTANGIVKVKVTDRYKIVYLSLDGTLLLNQINHRLQTAGKLGETITTGIFANV
jgi:hypothetical protein